MNNERLTYLTKLIAEHDDEKAFDEFFHLAFPGLYSFVNSITHDRQAANEVIEDVFIKLWNNRKILPSLKSIFSYIYTLSKNEALNFINRKSTRDTKRILPVGDFGDAFSYRYDPDDVLISEENIQIINSAIGHLPPRCRLIFRLIKEDQLKYTEVAELLGISIKTVESQMFKALKILTNSLEKDLPEFSAYYNRKKISEN